MKQIRELAILTLYFQKKIRVRNMEVGISSSFTDRKLAEKHQHLALITGPNLWAKA